MPPAPFEREWLRLLRCKLCQQGKDYHASRRRQRFSASISFLDFQAAETILAPVVGSLTNEDRYTVSPGSTEPQPVTYRFDDASWLKVSYYDLNTLVVVDLALGSDYTVTGDGRSITGNVILTPAFLATLDIGTLIIKRNTPALQPLDLDYTSQIPSVPLETELDRLTMIAQDNDLVRFALTFPPTDPDGTNRLLPNHIIRAGGILGFDITGNAVVVPVPIFNNAAALVAAVAAAEAAQSAADDAAAAALQSAIDAAGYAPLILSGIPDSSTFALQGQYGQYGTAVYFQSASAFPYVWTEIANVNNALLTGAVQSSNKADAAALTAKTANKWLDAALAMANFKRLSVVTLATPFVNSTPTTAQVVTGLTTALAAGKLYRISGYFWASTANLNTGVWLNLKYSGTTSAFIGQWQLQGTLPVGFVATNTEFQPAASPSATLPFLIKLEAELATTALGNLTIEVRSETTTPATVTLLALGTRLEIELLNP